MRIEASEGTGREDVEGAASAVCMALRGLGSPSPEAAARGSCACELLFCMEGAGDGHHPLAVKIAYDLHRLQHELDTKRGGKNE